MGPLELYDRVYNAAAGTAPDLRRWHHQWLAVEPLHRDLREILPTLGGDVVDIGCGDKPYAAWLGPGSRVTGLDTYPGPRVDVVIEPNREWPLDSGRFDAAICTQVLEHVTDLDHVLAETHRILRSGGALVASVPFAYPEHGAPHDYRRFSQHEIRRLLMADYEITDLRTQGGSASTAALHMLIWLDTQARVSRPLFILRAALFPISLALIGLVNLVAHALDAVDATGAAYGNLLVVARKR